MPAGRIAGRVALVTGSSRGIGRSIALALAREGADVIVAAKTVEADPRLPGTILPAAQPDKGRMAPDGTTRYFRSQADQGQ